MLGTKHNISPRNVVDVGSSSTSVNAESSEESGIRTEGTEWGFVVEFTVTRNEQADIKAELFIMSVCCT